MRTSSRVAIMVALFFPAMQAAAADGSCEATPAVQTELNRLKLPELSYAQRREQQRKLIAQLLATHPDDLFLNLKYQSVFSPKTEAERSALIERYRQLSVDHPNNAAYEYLYANVLLDKDTPRSIAIAQEISASGINFARGHLLLSEIYYWGKFADRTKAQQQIAAFFADCPSTEDERALELASRFGDKALQEHIVSELQTQLPKEKDPESLDHWEILWNLEFKVHPVSEHAQVRKQIIADLHQLQATRTAAPDAQWLAFLRNGYHLAGDEPVSKAEEVKLVAQFPESDQAKRIESENWDKEHPWPGTDEAKQKPYWTAVLARANSLLQKDAEDEGALHGRFQAESELDNVSTDQLTADADAMLTVMHREQDTFYSPPLEFQVAQAFLKKKVHADRVPELVGQGWSSIASMYGLPSDNNSAERQKRLDESTSYVTRESALILLDAAQQLGKPEVAREAVAKVEAEHLTKPSEKSLQLHVEAQWAEIQGRKLDALLLYKAALDSRTAEDKPKKDDKLAENLDRLWKELGGTDASHTFLATKTIPAAAEEGRWEKPDKEMKTWQLTDLNGQTWKLASLEGKTVLINFWATWCGPCKAEHPHLQRLYEQLKNNPHIQIITFNVDDEIGNVAPYIAENKYTFPVLLAKNYADDMSVDSIPRNWVIDAQGKWKWQQIGFGQSDSWEKEMKDKLTQQSK